MIAALCMKAGLARDTALRAITSSPAAIFGLVQNGPQNTAGPGHIACGAPADLVVWEGDPFSLTGRPRLVMPPAMWHSTLALMRRRGEQRLAVFGL